MPDREHTSKHYELQLRQLKDKLLLMSHHAEQMIADAIKALVERRPSLAAEVIARDDTLDKLEIEIDNLCYQILALEQPVARDLRFIATALKIVKDIERIGDTAVNIAERAVETKQALTQLGFKRHEVAAAIETTRAHVGRNELTLEQWIKIALSYCPKPTG